MPSSKNKGSIGDRDITSSTPPSWRIPFVFAMIISVVATLCWIGWVEITIANNNSRNKIPDAEIKWGDEFDLFGNMKNCFTSLRGEKIILMVLATCFSCFIIHFFVWIYFKKVTPKEIYDKISFRDAWFLGQKIPSSLHGLGVGIMAVKIIWIDHVFDSDIINGYSPMCDIIMSYSMGYEFYDILVMYMQTGSSIGMYIHHLSLCVAFLLSFTHKKLAFVAVIMLITELTVLPSNLHWYLKIFKRKATRLFHFNQGVRLWSFVILRLPVPCYVYYQIYEQYDIFKNEHVIARTAVYTVVTLLALMNVYWTKTMFILYMNRTTLKEQLAQKNKKQK